ncbi:TPA: DNA polymerase I [Clostridioides difficile]|nr:DNA polymerase I [Clostridioides difficile]
MELNLNLDVNWVGTKKATKTAKRVKEAVTKKAKAKYIPTWDEVWITGYTSHTGSVKKAIFQTKIDTNTMNKLQDVKTAIETGEIGTGLDDLRKFTKTYALGLYKVLQETRRDGIIKKMVEEMPSNYHCITEIDELFTLCDDLEKEELIAVDTETTGVDIWGEDVIVGISLSLDKADRHYYIPVRHNLPDKQLLAETVFTALNPVLEDRNIKKVLHNAKFDIHMLAKEGIKLQGLYMDTMVAMFTLNENEPSYALKNLATKYGSKFGFEDKSSTYEELFGKGGFENTPLDIGTVYACKDTHLTLKFHKWIMSHFDRLPQLKDLYFNIELPTTEVCVEMEQNGFNIDMEYAEAYRKDLEQQVGKLQAEISEGFGDININSNQQLAEVIYDVWGVQDDYKRSVDAHTLKTIVVNWERHIPQVKYIRALLDYRALNKLLTTYVIPLPEKTGKDGRLRGAFNQMGAKTGRFASNNPNLQNLPYDARKLITASEGKIIVGIDYSQIEPRVLSHIAEDDILKEPYLTGKDLYSSLASVVFKQPIEECGDGSKWRKLAKVVLLATMYGTSAYTLSQQVGITPEEAEGIIDDFYNSYEAVANFINGTHTKADTDGYVETMYGRKRRFIGHQTVAKRFKALEKRVKEIVKKDKFNIWTEKNVPRELKTQYWEASKEYGRVNRQSVNAIIQGTSADIMKIAMINLKKHLDTKGDDWRILATVHDEVLMEIPETATKEEIDELNAIQRDAVKLSIPFKCDVEISKRWGEGVPYAKWLEDRSII